MKISTSFQSNSTYLPSQTDRGCQRTINAPRKLYPASRRVGLAPRAAVVALPKTTDLARRHNRPQRFSGKYAINFHLKLFLIFNFSIPFFFFFVFVFTVGENFHRFIQIIFLYDR